MSKYPKILNPTFDAISQLNSISNCSIPDLDFIPQVNTLQKGERELILTFKAVFDPNIHAALRSFDLGNLTLSCVNGKYIIPSREAYLSESASSILSTVAEPFYLHINRITTFTTPSCATYKRMVLPVSRDNWCGEMAACGFSVGQQSHVGLLDLDFPLGQVHAYTISYSAQKYLIVEPQYKVSLDEIYDIQYAVALGLGLIAGTVPLNECYVVSSETLDFSNIENIEYRRLRETIVSAYRLFTTNMYSIYEALKKGIRNNYATIQLEDSNGTLNTGYVDWLYPRFYSKLITILYQDADLARAAEIMIEASDRSLGYQVSLYSVALETITTRLKSVFNVKYPGIIDKSTWKKLHKSIVKSYEQISKELSFTTDIHDRYKRTLDNMNNISNQEKFNLVMNRIGHKRSASDDDAISQRNLSLHGSQVNKTSPNSTDADDYFYYSTVLCRLCYCLLFRYCGFDNYIINLPVLYDLEPACNLKEQVLIKI